MDYYLEDRSRLNGQPKRTIAEYVEQEGILVPQIFGSLNDARKTRVSVIARSEHPDEYNRFSGLLESVSLEGRLEIGTEEQLRAYVFSNSLHEDYCRLLYTDQHAFEQKVSFSYWEKLGGYNRTIVADSAVPKRYHIMTYQDKPNGKEFKNYTLYDDTRTFFGTVEMSVGDALPLSLRIGLSSLVAFYERVRNLDRFDPQHCPIIEAQTVGRKNYFLQYHRSRDFVPADFILNRRPRKGEIPALFVRGATPKTGLRYPCVTAAYPASGMLEFKQGLPTFENGTLNDLYDNAFSEIMTRRRHLQIIQGNKEAILRDIAAGHYQRSQLFQPTLSVILPPQSLLPKELHESMKKMARTYGHEQWITVDVVSDGKNAFIRRV